MVTIDGGVKVYEAVSVINGKPCNVGWKTGKVPFKLTIYLCMYLIIFIKVVQRPHKVKEVNGSIYVVIKDIFIVTLLKYIQNFL